MPSHWDRSRAAARAEKHLIHRTSWQEHLAHLVDDAHAARRVLGAAAARERGAPPPCIQLRQPPLDAAARDRELSCEQEDVPGAVAPKPRPFVRGGGALRLRPPLRPGFQSLREALLLSLSLSSLARRLIVDQMNRRLCSIFVFILDLEIGNKAKRRGWR